MRDLLLDRPVFWVADQTYLMSALGAACLTFFLAHVLVLPVAAGVGIFLLRLAAIRWELRLPRFSAMG